MWSTRWISHQCLLCWFEDLRGASVGLWDGLGFAMACALLRNNLKALLFLSLLHPQLAGGAGQQPQQQQQPGLPAQGLQEEGDQIFHRALVREKREGSLDSAEQRRGHGAGSVSNPNSHPCWAGVLSGQALCVPPGTVWLWGAVGVTGGGAGTPLLVWGCWGHWLWAPCSFRAVGSWCFLPCGPFWHEHGIALNALQELQ